MLTGVGAEPAGVGWLVSEMHITVFRWHSGHVGKDLCDTSTKSFRDVHRIVGVDEGGVILHGWELWRMFSDNNHLFSYSLRKELKGSPPLTLGMPFHCPPHYEREE